MRPPPLEQPQSGVGRQVAAEGQLEIEGAVVITARGLGREQLLEELLAPFRDAVDLLGPAAPLGLPAGPEGGCLAGHRTGHRDRSGRRRLECCLHRLDGAGRLQAGQRRIERAERDARKGAERGRQPLLEFVAVELLLLEQAQDGEFQHVST